jgi:predicted metal-dependent hydrolase
MILKFLSRAKPALPDHLDVSYEGTVYRVALLRNPRARRITLRASAAKAELILTLPPRVSLATAEDFLARHGGWIASRAARFEPQIAFEPGAMIPLRGTPHQITHRAEARGTVWTEEDDTGQALLIVAGDIAFCSRRVTDFLKKEARQDLDHAVAKHTATLGLPARKIALRDTKSRWGSCSARGHLNFSWRLILAPSFVLDYLAAHEVAHLKEMNHSTRYWKVVERLDPQFERAEAWLKRNGTSLHRYG